METGRMGYMAAMVRRRDLSSRRMRMQGNLREIWGSNHCFARIDQMLVYEYVDNGNLEQWLHGDVGPISPLDIRMKIAIGTTKGSVFSFLCFNSLEIHYVILDSSN
ncbi:hypothetical protein K1719_011655 [Acacia pycnantha]|nr:hypothetical protein K1719_011655 [Acacia pycnantha]